MFDQSKEFEIPILSGGEKRCVVRWPTDEEWCARIRESKTVRTYLGREKELVDQSASERADARLLAKIRVDGGEPAFDQAEASRVIGRLDRYRLCSIDREPNAYTITVKVCGAQTVHHLKMPTAADASEFRRFRPHEVRTGNRTESFFTLEPLAGMYDRLQVSVDGYAGKVPVNHKASVLLDLMEVYESDSTAADLEDDEPEIA